MTNNRIQFTLNSKTHKAVMNYLHSTFLYNNLSDIDKIKLFVEKIIISAYINLQPLKIFREENKNFRKQSLKFSMSTARSLINNLLENEGNSTMDNLEFEYKKRLYHAWLHIDQYHDQIKL